MTNNTLGKIAFLIPAHNEEKVIGHTIASLLRITVKDNIFVINDGSLDATSAVAKNYTDHVITIPNGGKADAINSGFKLFDLLNKYEYVMPVDADTVMASNLERIVTQIFEADNDKKIAAVICKVRGRATNLLTSFRMWEYEISQIIHKSAQGVINAILVCPGCSTVYRSEVFRKTKFPSRTLTEDMDLTFIIHRKRLGKIVFTQDTEVITQDPKTLREYVKQVRRWYTGFWMSLIKHNVPWGGQTIDAEVAMLATEGVFNGLLALFFAIGIPTAIILNPSILIYPFSLDLLLFTIPTIAYIAIKYKVPKLFLYLPAFYVLRIFNSILFLRSFLIMAIGMDHKKRFIWDTARYEDGVGKEGLWATQLSQ